MIGSMCVVDKKEGSKTSGLRHHNLVSQFFIWARVYNAWEGFFFSSFLSGGEWGLLCSNATYL